MFVQGGYSDDQLVDVEALRYLYLSTQLQSLQSSKRSSPLRLLLLGDYLDRHNNSMISLLSRVNSDLLDRMTITVKPHPACAIDVAANPRLNLHVVSSPLPVLFQLQILR